MKKIAYFFIIGLFFLYPTFSIPNVYDLEKKYVALSFDDGPSKYTQDIVNYLIETNSNATFFVIGENALKNKDIVLYIANSNLEIGNHTYTHPWLSKLNDNEIKNEIKNTQDIIYNLTGYIPVLFRPSYGDINNRLRNIIDLELIMWTNDSKDWKYKSSKTIASNVIRNVKNFDIILMHDTYKRTYESLKIIIPKLKDMGYEIVSVSELLEIKRFNESKKQ